MLEIRMGNAARASGPDGWRGLSARADQAEHHRSMCWLGHKFSFKVHGNRFCGSKQIGSLSAKRMAMAIHLQVDFHWTPDAIRWSTIVSQDSDRTKSENSSASLWIKSSLLFNQPVPCNQQVDSKQNCFRFETASRQQKSTTASRVVQTESAGLRSF